MCIFKGGKRCTCFNPREHVLNVQRCAGTAGVLIGCPGRGKKNGPWEGDVRKRTRLDSSIYVCVIDSTIEAQVVNGLVPVP